MMEKTTIDLDESEEDVELEDFSMEQAFDHIGFGRSQYLLMFACGFYWSGDAMELMLAGFLMPELEKEFSLETSSEKAITAAIVFLGISIGSYVFGFLSDKIGRRKVFAVSSFFTGIFGIASAFAPSFWLLIVLRGVMGFFLGGGPTAFAYFGEFVPTSSRGKALIWFNLFWTFGTLLESFLAYFVLPDLGWRWLLGISSIPILLLSFTSPFLPESPRYDAARGRPEIALGTLRKLAARNRSKLPDGMLTGSSAVPPKVSLFALLQKPFTKISLLLWILWAITSFCYYGIVLYTSEHFRLAGHEDVLLNTLITSAAEIPGVFIVVLLVDSKLGRKGTQSVMFCAAAFATLLLITPSTPEVIVVSLSVISRMSILASFATIYLLTPEIYPTPMRTSGLGACAAASKLASIITPFVSVIEVNTVALIVYGGLALVASWGTLFLVETRGKPLCETAAEFEEEQLEDADHGEKRRLLP